MKKDISEIVEGFFTGICDVINFEEYQDEYGITQHTQKTVLQNVPCRLCYKNIKSAIKGKASDYISQKVTLLVGRDVLIKNGSVIKVFQNGQTTVYQKTGEAAVYDSHREIEMALNNNFS